MSASDPLSVARTMDEVWNDHDVDAAVDLFTDDAIVRMQPPASPGQEVLRGKQEIRQWVQDFIRQNFHVESRNYSVTGNTVSWQSDVHLDGFASVGVDPAVFFAEAVIENGKVRQFTARMSDQSARQLEEAMAAQQGRA